LGDKNLQSLANRRRNDPKDKFLLAGRARRA
jgi:hypothetical protein